MPVTHILVVDDYLPWQRFISLLLESETDLKLISVASDGVEAVQRAKELQPDVILMDVSLPRINGFEATRQIRVVSPGSKTLFLSEHCGSEFVQAAFEVGGFGYVLKSDSHVDLVSGIRAVLLDRQFLSTSLMDWRQLDSEGTRKPRVVEDEKL